MNQLFVACFFLACARNRYLENPQPHQEDMEDKYEKILERVFPNEKTRENYASRLRSLVKRLKVASLQEVLEAPETFYPKMQETYESLTTRRNVITAILVLFREDPDLAPELREKWKLYHDTLTRHQEVRIKRSEPEDKQVAKYTSFEEIEAKYGDLKSAAAKPHATRQTSMQFVLLSLLVHMRPKRADLGSVEIYNDADPATKDQNYIVLRKRGSFLAMNIYKTSKHYATIEEDLPDAFVSDLRASLKRWPRKYLFVKEDGEPMSNNTYSQFVMRTFKELFGRGTGVSLLRDIYISEKLDFDNMTLEEQEEEARLMLHTSGLQRRYKWPKKVLCPKLCAAYLPPTRRTRRSNKAAGASTAAKATRKQRLNSRK
jgi:hypothetical protein